MKLMPFIGNASDYINSIKTNHELECLSTIVFLIEEQNVLSDYEIVAKFKSWSEDKANRYSEDEILRGIGKLYNDNILEKTLTGYVVLNGRHE